MTPAAQMLRNIHEIRSREISAETGVPRISTLFRRRCAERYSFQPTAHRLLEFSHDPTGDSWV